MNDVDVLTIDCTEPKSCACTPIAANSCGEVDEDLHDPDFDMSKADQCRMMCGKQSQGASSEKCYFYRWEKHEHNDKKYVCKMRSCMQNPCSGADPCTDENCMSGHISVEGGALPTPDPAEPAAKCPGKFDYNVNKIHWRCINTHPQSASASERSTLGINPYMDDTLDADTICITMKKCSAWNEHAEDVDDNMKYQLVARCDGDHINTIDGDHINTIDGVDFGIWIVDGNLTGSYQVTKDMIVDNKLSEPDLAENCDNKCEDFKLDGEVLDDSGVEVFCSYPLLDSDGDGKGDTIIDGNSCILLCDQVLKHSVSCVYNADNGSKRWQEEDKDEEMTTDQFKCEWTAL